MAVTQQVRTFRTPLNRSASDLVTQFNAVFSTIQANIQDIDYSRLQSPYGAGDISLKVLYYESDDRGVQYEARYYRSDVDYSAQDHFNAEFAAGLCRVPLHFLDITDHEVGKSSQDQLLVICAVTNRASPGEGQGLVGLDTAVFMAWALGDIGPNATGLAELYDAWGQLLDNSAPIYNADPINVMASGDRTLVVYDVHTGLYIGVPTCCLPKTPLTSCSTTPALIPTGATPCETKEVVSFWPQDPALNAWTSILTTPPP